ncbi:ammonium transporter [Effusibacillus dendaii]|uniref:Ammonium transporter n=1 Tax=Effusibacillus dendaii TaxID=2743772 RepID=A0A7I8DGG8_9BACL|nr:ammonium transporter [Effusibacillus dendaii]BCJ86891.1 ammonium transporter [Effusibacillus dendaii]
MDNVVIGLNTVWVVLAAAMIVFMEGGFSLLEAGLVRTKNAVNVTMKIFVDLTFGALAFYLVGFAFMFGGDWSGVLGIDFSATSTGVTPNQLPISAFVLFQIAFAMAVASIISGAVAERMKFSAYIVTVMVVCGILYPISGHWIWGGGWLQQLGMKDFAGSAAIHAMGGFAAFALAMVLGPRKNRFNKDGSVNVFAPSNIPLASAGAFILWFGWFGFNAGSTLNALDSNLSHIALNTFLAAASGGASAVLYTMARFKVADPSMAINGSLAGLVAITAGCAYVGPKSAILIGFIAGVLVILATGWVDKMKVDDPVGAVAVHGFNGAFGTIAVGLFDTQQGLFFTGSSKLLMVQIAGVLVACVWGFVTAYGLGILIKKSIGIRVTASQEEEGLDVIAHGIPAYNELERFSDTGAVEYFAASLEPTQQKPILQMQNK